MRVVAASSLVVALAVSSMARSEPPLRTPKKWTIETTLPTPTSIDLYASTLHTMETWVRDRALWQRNDLLVTLLHGDDYLTIISGRLSSIAPGAFFFVGPAGFASGTMFALQVPF